MQMKGRPSQGKAALLRKSAEALPVHWQPYALDCIITKLMLATIKSVANSTNTACLHLSVPKIWWYHCLMWINCNWVVINCILAVINTGLAFHSALSALQTATMISYEMM